MKSTKNFRVAETNGPEDLRRGTKLPPIKKSSKDRLSYYDDDDDITIETPKKESVFDYFDDGDEDL